MEQHSFAINYIKSNNLIGIKAGTSRTTYLEIWMVVVENRIFARSWGLAEKSWFNTFLSDPIVGKIKCGDVEISITAKIPTDLVPLSDKISQAYIDKYTAPENLKYAQGIAGNVHVEKTMEFIVIE